MKVEAIFTVSYINALIKSLIKDRYVYDLFERGDPEFDQTIFEKCPDI